MRRRGPRRDPVRVIDNPEAVPHSYLREVRSAATRAIRSGARPPLSYVGIGMTSVVFRDVRGHAFKVPSHDDGFNRSLLAQEAEWLRVASTEPEIRSRVAKLKAFHPRYAVIEKEYIEGWRPGRRPRRSRPEIHEQVGTVMRRHGFSAPEFKEDSYVFTRGRGYVLVDAGFSHLKGTRLAARAAQVLKGTRFHGETPSELAWSLRMEGGKTLPVATAESLSAKLEALPDAKVRPEGGIERDRERRRMKSNYLPLRVVVRFEAQARRLGVSKVARSSRGFLTAYKRAGGRPERLTDYWQRRREGFIRRHMAQAKAHGESIFRADGSLTRRHLALIMWAYSPSRIIGSIRQKAIK